jgi:hypothetical protein
LINSNLSKITILSFLGLIATIVIGAYVGAMIPTTVDLDNGNIVAKSPMPSKPYYTKEEMDRADEEYEEKVKRFRAQKKAMPRQEFLLEGRIAGIPFSWIPWIFIPWVGRIKWTLSAILLMIFPVVGVLTHLIYPMELMFCFLGSLFGVWGLGRLEARRVMLNETPTEK